jgi:hypothetical protein
MHNNSLYENVNSGSIVCEKHLGCEATARFAAKPNAKSVMTSFGKIAKMTEADATDWISYVGERYPNGCESCR